MLGGLEFILVLFAAGFLLVVVARPLVRMMAIVFFGGLGLLLAVAVVVFVLRLYVSHEEEPIEISPHMTELISMVSDARAEMAWLQKKSAETKQAETKPSRQKAAEKERADKKPTEQQPAAQKPAAAKIARTGEPRPVWMDEPTGRLGNSFRAILVSEPYVTRQECDEQLTLRMQAAAREYIETYLGEMPAEKVQLSPDYLRRHVLRKEWEEHLSTSVGEMVQVHGLLDFDDKVRREIDGQWRAVKVRTRLGYVAAGGGSVLALLASLFGYLKVSTRRAAASKSVGAPLAAAAVAIVFSVAQGFGPLV
jgi:hypothetical protein